MVVTASSAGPATWSMSGFILPGWVTCRPSFITNRRLNATHGDGIDLHHGGGRASIVQHGGPRIEIVGDSDRLATFE